MAKLPGVFDATTVPPAPGGADVWPIGKNVAQIVANEMKATNDGTGQYLLLTLEGVLGEATGLRIYDRLNIINASETAEKIARGTLSAICHAVGKMQVEDADELMWKPLVIDIKPGSEYTDSKTGEKKMGLQTVKSYAAYDASKPLPASAPAPVASKPAAGWGAKPATAPSPVNGHTPPPNARPAGGAGPWARTGA